MPYEPLMTPEMYSQMKRASSVSGALEAPRVPPVPQRFGTQEQAKEYGGYLEKGYLPPMEHPGRAGGTGTGAFRTPMWSGATAPPILDVEDLASIATGGLPVVAGVGKAGLAVSKKLMAIAGHISKSRGFHPRQLRREAVTHAKAGIKAHKAGHYREAKDLEDAILNSPRLNSGPSKSPDDWYASTKKELYDEAWFETAKDLVDPELRNRFNYDAINKTDKLIFKKRLFNFHVDNLSFRPASPAPSSIGRSRAWERSWPDDELKRLGDASLEFSSRESKAERAFFEAVTGQADTW